MGEEYRRPAARADEEAMVVADEEGEHRPCGEHREPAGTRLGDVAFERERRHGVKEQLGEAVAARKQTAAHHTESTTAARLDTPLAELGLGPARRLRRRRQVAAGPTRHSRTSDGS